MPINPMRLQNYLVIGQGESKIIRRTWLLKSMGINVEKEVEFKPNLKIKKEEEIKEKEFTAYDLEQIKNSGLQCYMEKGKLQLTGFYQSESCQPHTKKPFCVTIPKNVKTIIIRKILTPFNEDYDRDIKMLFLNDKGEPVEVKIKINVNTPEEKEETSVKEVLLYNRADWRTEVSPDGLAP